MLAQIFLKVKNLKKLPSLINYLLNKDNCIATLYYSEIANVGDALNVELVSFLSGKKVVKPFACRYLKHLLAVGSVLQVMNKNSIVWGSGLISDDCINEITECGTILAVRGFLTKEKLENHFNIILDVPLGDPALLMPLIYPASEVRKYKFGFVPHYVDSNHPIGDVVRRMGGVILDVAWEPRKFIAELTSCEKVISSAMHGLILSDAYGVPNKRVKLSNNIHGGEFKFRDYYSTTDSADEHAYLVDCSAAEDEIHQILSLAKAKKIQVDLVKLRSSLEEYLNKNRAF